MKKNRDEEFDRLIASDPDLEVAVERVRKAFTAEPSEPKRQMHLAQVMSVAKRPAVARRRTARIAAAAVLATSAFGGLAYAGALPDAMQDALSDAATKAGFTLPASDAHRNGNSVDADQGGDKSVSEDVHSVLDQDFDSGRDKGDAVSDAANQNRRSEGSQPSNPPTSTVTDTVTDPQPDHGRGPPAPGE